MNETKLTQLLDDATRTEPPMGLVVSASMRAGDRLRWRRRLSAAGIVAALTALAAVVPTVAFGARQAPSAPAWVGRTGTAFVVTSPRTVVAVNLGTGMASRPIRVPTIKGVQFQGHPMATAPDGRTVWVMGSTELTPIDTQTDQTGPPIRLHARGVFGALITADGTRAYVPLSPSGVLVVDLRTGMIVAEIKGPDCRFLVPSPDGKLLYCGSNGVSIISTTTNAVLWTLSYPLIPGITDAISVARDSTTAYAFSDAADLRTAITHINAATGATSTITIRNSGAAAFAPSDALVYAGGQRALYAVNPVSGKTVRHWQLPATSVSALAFSPDGSTAYALGYARGRAPKVILVMVNLHSGHVERLIHLPYLGGNPEISFLQVSPDGRTVYVELEKVNLTMSYDVAIAASSGRIIASTPVQDTWAYPVAFAR